MIEEFQVNYIRDGLTEEFHTGLVQYGFESNYLTPYYIRSCAKPLQASLLIDYKIDFTSEELAFCSGSHAGEDCHVEVARSILRKLDIDESYLKCGVHPPLARTMQDKMLLKNETPSEVHNNCSGKHLGFLAICKKNNWDMETYYLPEHPLQKEVKHKIYDLCEIKKEYPATTDGCGGVNKFSHVIYPSTTDGCGGVNKFSHIIYPSTTDGCGVPIVSMPLKNLVKGYKNLAEHYPKLVQSILNNPYIYGGENRLDTEIIQNSDGIIAKVGAGGLCVVYNTKINDGFAVKINDASMSARRVAVLEILKRLGWCNIAYDNTIKTISGKKVGEIEVILG